MSFPTRSCLFRSILAFAAAALCGSMALAGVADWGDAPEGAVAYPSAGGVLGGFPTCMNTGPSGWIEHANTPPNWAYWGGFEDYEVEGNAGNCPFFPPYEADECFQDGDAGLMYPATYTIISGVEVPCVYADTLHAPCDTAVWGVDIDIAVTNNGPWPGYVNIIFDWNQNGFWGDTVLCPQGSVLEHVVVDVVVPPGYAGLLSGLLFPGGFTVGPNNGFVWARFSIMTDSVGVTWDGSGWFEGGESEDYLFYVDDPLQDEGDYGDAPEGATGYPDGTNGSFPTCANVGPPGSFILHQALSWPLPAYLGAWADAEAEGNGNLCPTFNPYDNDECYQDGDAGLLIPAPWTISGLNFVPCSGQGETLGVVCTPAVWGSEIDVDVTNNGNADAYVNVLFDWNHDGQWGGASSCPTGPAPEHVLVDYPVPPGFTGALSLLGPPFFLIGPDSGFVWARISITERVVYDDWDGSGRFDDGETEDYLLRVVDVATGVEESGGAPARFRLENLPNPFNPSTTIRFEMPVTAPVTLRVYDASGRAVRALVENETRTAGTHEVLWDGRDGFGTSVASGVYFYRLDAGPVSLTRRMVLVK